MHKLVLLRHGQSSWNLENRFTGWTDVDLTRARRPRGAGRREALQGGRLRVRPRLRVGAAPGHPHGVAGPRRDGPDVAADDVRLAAQRAALRLAPGAGQGRDRREVRRRAGPRLAAQLRRAAAAAREGRPALPRPRPALPGAERGPTAADGEPEGDRRAASCRCGTRRSPRRSARGSASCWRRTATRCGRWSSTSTA